MTLFSRGVGWGAAVTVVALLLGALTFDQAPAGAGNLSTPLPASQAAQSAAEPQCPASAAGFELISAFVARDQDNILYADKELLCTYRQNSIDSAGVVDPGIRLGVRWYLAKGSTQVLSVYRCNGEWEQRGNVTWRYHSESHTALLYVTAVDDERDAVVNDAGWLFLAAAEAVSSPCPSGGAQEPPPATTVAAAAATTGPAGTGLTAAHVDSLIDLLRAGFNTAEEVASNVMDCFVGGPCLDPETQERLAREMSERRARIETALERYREWLPGLTGEDSFAAFVVIIDQFTILTKADGSRVFPVLSVGESVLARLALKAYTEPDPQEAARYERALARFLEQLILQELLRL
jgi:hypothetical protein